QVPAVEVQTRVPVEVARVREVGGDRALGPRLQDALLLRGELEPVLLGLGEVAERVEDDAGVLVGLDVLLVVRARQRVAVEAPAVAEVRDLPGVPLLRRARAPPGELA